MEKSIPLEMHKALEELFSFVPPKQLKRSMYEIFSNYLQTLNDDTDLNRFKLLAEDFYFLYQFFEKAEEFGFR